MEIDSQGSQTPNPLRTELGPEASAESPKSLPAFPTYLGRISLIANVYGGPHHRSAWLFLRLLGAVHMISAWSLWIQYEGLIGSRGLAPSAQWMERLAANSVAWWQVPTLAWWSASDSFLAGLCGAQFLGGLLLLTGLLAWPSLVLAGVCALSLMLVGGPFLSFQWDALLVETTFFALFLQPFTGWRPSAPARQPYHRVGLLLLQVLTFKLMLSAGLVKLASGDKVWADASALSYHFFTQPLPTWTAWHVQQWPAGVLKALCLAMFFIELVCPFLLLLPRWFRAGGGVFFVLLMVGIAATGNYTFFNLLSAALALTWIDDRFWRATVSRWISLEPATPPAPTAAAPWRRIAPILAGFLFLPLHLWLTFAAGGRTRSTLPPAPWGPVLNAVRPFAVMNSYGLFAVMTTRRPEISVELSADGHLWFAVEFRNKPGDTFKPPAFVAPHQPRLDWQMWFAALADGSPQPWQHSPWLISLLQALLEQRPEVQKLLAVLPKGIGTPRFARCMVTDYEFTSRAERAANGAWWKRVNPPRPFVPPVSLAPQARPL